ncbi:MAG: hypothetical protein U0169_04215 [Polyangiaceae bacterium]
MSTRPLFRVLLPCLALVVSVVSCSSVDAPTQATPTPDLGKLSQAFGTNGCADGTREGFTSLVTYPGIAACSGGFSVPGVLTTTTPACSRGAGNSGANPTGTGCNIADLCGEGWHVCRTGAEVATRAPSGCDATIPTSRFYATRQSSTGCNACATGTSTAVGCADPASCTTNCLPTAVTANDLYGCGGSAAVIGGACGNLNPSANLCANLPSGWACGASGTAEATNVTVTSATAGGALCCIDSCALDSDCPTATQYCDGQTSTCAPKLANGTALPNDAPLHTAGTCTTPVGLAICTSGVCDTSDNRCGYANGRGPCTTINAGTVCRSGACSSNLTCMPAGGCNVDADCTGTQFCGSGNTCQAKAATGVAIPGGGTCAGGTSNRCLSGVCDADNVCGHANGQGGCTNGNASGTSGTCRSGVCDPSANAGAGLCRQCTSGNLTNCSGGTPLCDSATFTCAACNGDNGTGTTATCGAGTPYCPGGGGTCTSCGTSGGTATCTAMGATHSGGICQATGACGNACVNDGNCLAAQWCDTGASPNATCTADLANGVAIPNVPSHTNPTLNGVCTVQAATAVCTSGVCDTGDNLCGFANGTGPCTNGNAAVVCRSGACSTNGTCRPAAGCNVDGDCSSNQWCDTVAHTCQAKGDTGTTIPGGGTCTAGNSNRCSSGVCGADNVCGRPNGEGGCVQATASGASGTCRSGLCDESAGGGAGLCRQCTAGNTSNCAVATPFCDANTFACVACNGDNGTSSSATCPANAPYCPGGGGACTTCGASGGTVTCTAGGATHAGGVCQDSGACGNACVGDSNCASTQWCNTGASPNATCTADLANGTAIPNVPSHTNPALTGACTTAAASAVCASGVCDTTDDACGYANGTGPCDGASAATVCRSGTCSQNGTCVASGGCNVDADCSGVQWCDTTAHTCQAKGPTGSTIPGGGACTSNASTRCLSGVCDGTTCGRANGQGPCTTINAGGTAGICQSGVCNPAGNSGNGVCVQCTRAESNGCTGTTPVCDVVTNTCSACNGDDGTQASATCPATSPYCPGNGGACTTCGTAGGTTTCTAPGAVHAGGVCQGSGACATTCTLDANCASTQWCDNGASPMALCRADLPNGAAIPTVPTHTPPLTGACTPEAATAVCESGVCDTTDDACGFTNGQGPCTVLTGPLVCRSGACSTDGTCRPANGCNADGDCSSSTYCRTSTHECVPRAPTGSPIPDGGACTSGTSSRCLSGVCDGTTCGRANGQGPCTTTSASGPSGVCQSSVCDPQLGGGAGQCVQCTTANAGACGGATPICDSATRTCVACNGDDGTAVTAPCSASAPYCPGGGAACTTCGMVGGTVTCADAGAVHAGTTCQSNGACATACTGDGDCTAIQWCDTGVSPAAICRADLANGVSLPNVPSHTMPALTGMCTPDAAAAVCTSGVCDTGDDACGFRKGTGPCNTVNALSVCRTGACSTNLTCRTFAGCNVLRRLPHVLLLRRGERRVRGEGNHGLRDSVPGHVRGRHLRTLPRRRLRHGQSLRPRERHGSVHAAGRHGPLRHVPEWCATPSDSLCGLPLDASCAQNSDCRSGHCNPGTRTCGQCQTDSDCSSGNFCDAARACVPLLPNGQACDRAAQCVSAACEGGLCGKANGQACMRDNECQSANCLGGTCGVPVPMDGGVTDGGRDSGATDSGATDGGRTDGGADAGRTDAGSSDAGSSGDATTSTPDGSTAVSDSGSSSNGPDATPNGSDLSGGGLACAASPDRTLPEARWSSDRSRSWACSPSADVGARPDPLT